MASAVSRWPTDSTRELASSASIAVLAASAAAASAMERRTSILAGHLVIRCLAPSYPGSDSQKKNFPEVFFLSFFSGLRLQQKKNLEANMPSSHPYLELSVLFLPLQVGSREYCCA